MVQALTKGDEVMTIGGLMGRVLEVEESRILMQIASVEGKPVSIYMNRASVQVVLPKDTVQL